MKKRLFCLALCLLIVLPIFAGCKPASGLQVGYGRVNVTPQGPVPLAGLGSSAGDRITDVAEDDLYITCVAFKDEDGNTVLIYHMDILNTYDTLYAMIPVIASETGVPEDNIVLAATHNHSAPSINSTKTLYMDEYRVFFKQSLIDSGKAALQDLAPAEMYIAASKPENMVFVRHYVRDDGHIHGEGGSAADADRYVGHAAEADNDLQMIKFVRKGKQDVVLVNWQGHPRAHANREIIRCDVDVMRKRLEEDMDCLFAFFLGASGNQNNSSVIPAEQRTTDYVDHWNVLSDEALETAKGFTKVSTGKVNVIKETSLQSRTNGKSSSIPMTVFSIGDVAFLSAGYEMFSESGIELKAYSQFKMTFIATCSNGDFKYMPTLPTFKYTAYETGTATWHVKGTAEKLVEEYKKMLDQLSAM